MNTTLEVPPSGDKTGRKDSENIAQAVRTLQSATSDGCHSSLVLGGQYYVHAPGILLGTPDKPTKVILRSSGTATIAAMGEWNGEYVVRIIGARYGARVVAEGIRIDAANKASGILCDGVSAKSAIHDIEIRRANGVALSLNRCWCMSVQNVAINECVGTALVSRWLNAAHVDGLSVTGCRTTTGPLMHIDGLGSVFTNLHMEANDCGEFPLLYAKHSRDNSSVASSLRFVSQYHEANRCTKSAIELDSAQYVSIEGVSVMNHPTINDDGECFIRCRNGSRGVSVSGVTGYTMLREGAPIVLADGGKHYGLTCEKSAASHKWGSVNVLDWIKTANGAELLPWNKQY